MIQKDKISIFLLAAEIIRLTQKELQNYYSATLIKDFSNFEIE